MPWNPELAREYIGHLVDDVATWANDVTEDIRRLRQVSELDLSHPALMRAFVRGACGWDLATNCSMTFFYAICLGDRSVFERLMMNRAALAEAVNTMLYDDWKPVQDVWLAEQEAFLARHDIDELKKIAESGVEEV